MTTDVQTAPTLRISWTDRDRHRQLGVAAVVVFVAGTALAVFGFPPIDLHEPTHYLGIMAPSCGLTRGTTAILSGSLSRGLRYNPASPLVVVAAAVLLGRLLIGLGTGRWLELRMRISRFAWIVLAVAAVALEINQQLNARLLMS